MSSNNNNKEFEEYKKDFRKYLIDYPIKPHLDRFTLDPDKIDIFNLSLTAHERINSYWGHEDKIKKLSEEERKKKEEQEKLDKQANKYLQDLDDQRYKIR